LPATTALTLLERRQCVRWPAAAHLRESASCNKCRMLDAPASSACSPVLLVLHQILLRLRLHQPQVTPCGLLHAARQGRECWWHLCTCCVDVCPAACLYVSCFAAVLRAHCCSCWTVTLRRLRSSTRQRCAHTSWCWTACWTCRWGMHCRIGTAHVVVVKVW
jgi:hypothetical protein